MSRYALIIGNIVATVVEAIVPPVIPGVIAVNVDSQPQVSSGWRYDGANFTRPPVLSLTRREFWQRFTVAEREALQNMLATGTQNQKNKLNTFRDYLVQGGDVELNDDYVIASVNLMETAGVLAAGRAAQILAT